MDVNSTQRSRLQNHNKYLRYREEYERARNFSKELQTAQAQAVDKSATASSPEKTGKLPTDMPASGSSAATKPKNAWNQVQNSVATSSIEPLPFAQTSAPRPVAGSDRMLDKVKEYEPYIRAAASRYELPPELIAGVIWQESRGNFRAVSHCGAMGLMQLMPATAASLGVSNAFDPAQNIDGGSKYLRQMLDKFGRVDLAVAAYNAGPGNVAKFKGVPPFDETRKYVPKVLEFALSFQVAQAFVSTPSNAVKA